jgi:hypothetical protein
MANKTVANDASVADFIARIEDEKKRKDAQALVDLMREATGAEPKMWGDTIVGFGDYHYKYESGREADWFPVGFSPRKANLTVYISGGFERHNALLAKLGKHKISGGNCIYINKLADVDTGVLRELVKASKAWVEAEYP